MARRRAAAALALLAVVVGLILVAGALLALTHDRQTPAAFGATRPAPRLTSRPARNGLLTSGVTSASPSARALSLKRPAELRIPVLGVTAPAEEVRTRHGLLNVPDDVAYVGWWTGSAMPGSNAGASVIDGHVDSAADGEGALFHLTDLHAGQQVIVVARGGRRFGYRVYARRVYTKNQALPTTLFTATGPARLVLITCGGRFDTTTHSYLDNIAVLARPVTGK